MGIKNCRCRALDRECVAYAQAGALPGIDETPLRHGWLCLDCGRVLLCTIPLPTGIRSRSHNHRYVVRDPPSSPNTSSYSGPDLGCNSYRLNFVGWMACARFEDPCSSHHSVFLYHLHREFAPVNHSFFLRESRSFTTKTVLIAIPHTIYFVGGLDPSLHSSIVEAVICN